MSADEPMSGPQLHLLRGFVQWTWRDTNGRRVPIKTVDVAEEYVQHIASLGFDRFYTWTTRRPKRAAELAGGSVFFVGGERRAQTLFRMPFVDIHEEGDGYAICMRPELIRVERLFVGQVRGWRYLTDASPDLPKRDVDEDLPEDLAKAFDELGVG